MEDIPLSKTELKTRAALEEARATLHAEKASAESRLGHLATSRRDIELFGELAELEAHDAEIAKTRLAVDRAQARLAQVDTDLRAADEAAEQTRRRANYESAKKHTTDGRNALKDYVRAAEAAADALKRLGTSKIAIGAVNGALPTGAAAIEDPETTSGVNYRQLSILDRVKLPKLARDEFYFGNK
jgi:chromosome segregation ATPase